METGDHILIWDRRYAEKLPKKSTQELSFVELEDWPQLIQDGPLFERENWRFEKKILRHFVRR
jgi:hypothetical protein